jgi:hypothetical protein
MVHQPVQEECMRPLFVAILLAVGVVSVTAADLPLKFNGGIGVVPASRVDGTAVLGQAVRNVVRCVKPGGQPWVIRRLEATIGPDGRIEAEGRGLLLAGGNGIGTNGGQRVQAVLFCGADTPRFSSDLVALDAGGNFQIDGFLSPAPPPTCDNPVLLIVSGGGSWFAAGIPGR